jgi:protein SCO1/2
MNRKNVLVFIFTALLLFFGLYQISKLIEKPKMSGLEVFGNEGHRIPNFSFIDQDGKTITEADVIGKVYVVDYFFTTCKSICPVMSNELEQVADHFKNEDGVIFLSHTVDPETDSIPLLKAYAEKHHANSKQWHFLTGPKKDLYDLARTGYLLDAHEGKGDEDDFIHTQNFALIDKERQIRGFYDGTKHEEMEKLKADISKLLAED